MATVKFKTKSGQAFTVTEARLYRKREIALAHRKFFSTLPPYQLVSVNFYGQPVPSITTPTGGIVRLLTIIHEGEEVRGPSYMSSVLRVHQMRSPTPLKLIQ